MMKFLLCLAALFLCLPANAAPFGHSTYSPTPTAETVTANIAGTGATFPSNFVGWSDELTDTITNGYITGSNTSLCNLAGMLGPNGVLHIGGNAADTVSPPALTQTLANNIAAFMACMGSGWKLLYVIDMCMNNTATAVTHAGYIINALGVSNVIFQIGQEPPQACLSPQTEAQYQTQWNTNYAALIAAYPSAQFAAPEIQSTSAVQSYVGGLTPGLSGLTYVEIEYYPMPCCAIGFTPAQLLDSVPNPTGGVSFTANQSWAGGKMRMTAIGTDFLQGTGGFANTLMTSAFFVYFGETLFNDGWNGVSEWNVLNANGGTSGHAGYYNMFSRQSDGGFAPYPLFYGAYLLSRLQGQTSISTSKSGTGKVAAFATLNGNGNANILITNIDTATPVTVTPAQSTSWSTANVLLLDGGFAGCWSHNPTLGGQPIQEGGVWTGAPSTISNGGTVTIGPCGAALVQIQP